MNAVEPLTRCGYDAVIARYRSEGSSFCFSSLAYAREDAAAYLKHADNSQCALSVVEDAQTDSQACFFDNLPENVMLELMYCVAFARVSPEMPGAFESTVLGQHVPKVGPIFAFNKRTLNTVRVVLERVVFHRTQFGFSSWAERMLRGGELPEKVQWLALPKENNAIRGGAQAAVLFLVTPVLSNLKILEASLVDRILCVRACSLYLMRLGSITSETRSLLRRTSLISSSPVSCRTTTSSPTC